MVAFISNFSFMLCKWIYWILCQRPCRKVQRKYSLIEAYIWAGTSILFIEAIELKIELNNYKLKTKAFIWFLNERDLLFWVIDNINIEK